MLTSEHGLYTAALRAKVIALVVLIFGLATAASGIRMPAQPLRPPRPEKRMSWKRSS